MPAVIIRVLVRGSQKEFWLWLISSARLSSRESLRRPSANHPCGLCDPLHRRLRRLCYLHRRSDCYRVERSSSRAGLSPAVDQRLSRRTVIAWLQQLALHSKRRGRTFYGYCSLAYSALTCFTVGR